MIIVIFALVIWLVGACLVVHVFCSAAREFVSVPDRTLPRPGYFEEGHKESC